MGCIMLHLVVVVNMVSMSFRVRNSVRFTFLLVFTTWKFVAFNSMNINFMTLTIAIAAAADELFRLTIISQQKFARCVLFNQTFDYLYISDI